MTDNLLAAVVQLGQRLETQDNLATSAPIYVVQERRRVYGFDPDYSDTHVWIDGCNDSVEATPEEAAALDALEDHGDEVPAQWTKTAYQDEWDWVQPFFTRGEADLYVEQQRHNLQDPRVYVDSGHRNREWRLLREFFLEVGRGTITLSRAESPGCCP